MNWLLYIGVYAIGFFMNMVIIKQFCKENLPDSMSKGLKIIASLGALIWVWIAWKYWVN